MNLDRALDCLNLPRARRGETKAHLSTVIELLKRAYSQDKGADKTAVTKDRVNEIASTAMELNNRLNVDLPKLAYVIGKFGYEYHCILEHANAVSELCKIFAGIADRFPGKNVGQNEYRWTHRNPDITLASDAYSFFVNYSGEIKKRDTDARTRFENFAKEVFRLVTGENASTEFDSVLVDCVKYWRKVAPLSREIYRLRREQCPDTEQINKLAEKLKLTPNKRGF